MFFATGHLKRADIDRMAIFDSLKILEWDTAKKELLKICFDCLCLGFLPFMMGAAYICIIGWDCSDLCLGFIPVMNVCAYIHNSLILFGSLGE